MYSISGDVCMVTIQEKYKLYQWINSSLAFLFYHLSSRVYRVAFPFISRLRSIFPLWSLKSPSVRRFKTTTEDMNVKLLIFQRSTVMWPSATLFSPYFVKIATLKMITWIPSKDGEETSNTGVLHRCVICLYMHLYKYVQYQFASIKNNCHQIKFTWPTSHRQVCRHIYI